MSSKRSSKQQAKFVAAKRKKQMKQAKDSNNLVRVSELERRELLRISHRRLNKLLTLNNAGKVLAL
jgi:hypothetical protein